MAGTNEEHVYKSLYGIDHKVPEENIMQYTTKDFDKYGDKVAIVDGASGRSYTYPQLKALYTKCASGLTRRGFKKGDILCIYSPNVPEYLITVGAVLMVGGTVTTVNPLYTAEELRKQLQDATNTKFIVTIPQFVDKAKEVQKALPDIKEIFVFGESDGCTPFSELAKDDGSAFPSDVDIQMDDLAFLLYSSGTTGLPKGVMLTHRNIVSNMFQCLNTPGTMDYDPNTDVALALLPFYHVYGCVPIGLTSLKVGVKLVTLPRFEPEVFLKTLQDHKVTIGYLVPPLMIFLAKHPLVEKYDLSSLKDVISGAAPLGGEIAKAVKNRLSNVSYIRQGYGLTETSPVLTIGQRESTDPSSAGILIVNTDAKIVDPDSGKSLATGERGELWVRGPQVMKGYLNNPDATAASIDSDGYFHTGDIGYFSEDGHLFIIDRLKELIKYKGSQVAPAELEELLLTNPAVADAAVIGIPDEEAGELPKAFVVLKGTEQLTEEDISKFVAEKVAPHKKLRGGVEFVKAIPKSASGKILRRQLRDQEAAKK